MCDPSIVASIDLGMDIAGIVLLTVHATTGQHVGALLGGTDRW